MLLGGGGTGIHKRTSYIFCGAIWRNVFELLRIEMFSSYITAHVKLEWENKFYQFREYFYKRPVFVNSKTTRCKKCANNLCIYANHHK